MTTPDTITTADGRTISLSELEAKAKAAKEQRAMFGVVDRETCLALVAEVRRQAEEIASLREQVAALEAGMESAKSTVHAMLLTRLNMEKVWYEMKAPMNAAFEDARCGNKMAAELLLAKGASHE